MVIPFGLEDNEDKTPEDFLRRKSPRNRGKPLTVFNSEWRAGTRFKNDAESYHEGRSERAQTVDENHNAPLPDTLGQWARNPGRYDLPGVDTIPQSKREERGREFAESFVERGVVDEIVETDEPKKDAPNATGRESGVFDPYENQIRINESLSPDANSLDTQPGFVLAHEAGHAGDAFATEGFGTTSRGYEFDEQFEDENRKETVGQQLTKLSERARGEVPESGDQAVYRDSPNEKIADAAALATIEPRAARREAPDAVEFLEETGILDP